MALAKKTQPPVHEALAEAETRIFGKTVLRDADGAPMERGHGSRFAKLRHADRSHYLTLDATAAAEEAVRHSAALSATAAKMIRSQKDALAAAGKAAEEAAIAEINLAAAKSQIDTLNSQLAGAKAEILALKAELADAKAKR